MTMVTVRRPVRSWSRGALEKISERFETAPAEDVVEWAVSTFSSGLSLTCSFQDVVMLDLALRVEPRLEVVFLDTGGHFPETLAFVEQMRRRFEANLVVLRPGPEAAGWPCGTSRCCELRKVAPLQAHLDARDAWLSGLRRSEAPTRAATPIVAFDPRFDVVKVSPLATWSDERVARYVADRQLPQHPLVARGYPSIGCAPTTDPVAPGADARSGRWAGSVKTECGLHR